MRLHKTGHTIADTVSDLIGELPDGDYKIAYGILRHDLFHEGKWFEVDRGLWGANHFDGNYRASYKGTQPVYNPDGPFEPHGLELEPMTKPQMNKWTMICPPTDAVCKFFGIDEHRWMYDAALAAANIGLSFYKRTKEATVPIDWEQTGQVITFNSTVGIEALQRGIPVISDPIHSTIGSWNNSIDAGDRDKLFSFCAAHQFKLSDKNKLILIIEHYIDT